METKFDVAPKDLPEVILKIKESDQLDEMIRLAVRAETLEKMIAEIEKMKLN